MWQALGIPEHAQADGVRREAPAPLQLCEPVWRDVERILDTLSRED